MPNGDRTHEASSRTRHTREAFMLGALEEFNRVQATLLEVEAQLRQKHKDLDAGRMRIVLNNDGLIQALRSDRGYYMGLITMYAAVIRALPE
jgi:hypothetical protein